MDKKVLQIYLNKLETFETKYSLLLDLVNCVKIMKSIDGNPNINLHNILLDFGCYSSNYDKNFLKQYKLKHIKGLVDSLEE